MLEFKSLYLVFNDLHFVIQLSAFFLAVGSILTLLNQHVSDFLNEIKTNMLIEGLSASMFDSRISSRSVENILRNSFEQVRRTIDLLLKNSGINPTERYESQMISDKGKRDAHVERYNKLVDKFEKRKYLESVARVTYALSVIVHFLNFILVFRALSLSMN